MKDSRYTVMHQDACHKKCALLPRYSPGFLDFAFFIRSGTYTKLVKVGQNDALPGPTVVAPPFPGTNEALPAHRGATVLHRGSPGHTGGLDRARLFTVESRTFLASSWFTTVFDIVANTKHASTYSPVAFRSVHTGIEPPCLLQIFHAITA